MSQTTYRNVILQLDAPRRIKLNLFQSLAHDIVGLALAGLCSLDGGSLVDVPLIVDIELTESVGQSEDITLLELREFPGCLVFSDLKAT